MHIHIHSYSFIYAKANTGATTVGTVRAFPFGITRHICFFYKVGLSDQCPQPLLHEEIILALSGIRTRDLWVSSRQCYQLSHWGRIQIQLQQNKCTQKSKPRISQHPNQALHDSSRFQNSTKSKILLILIFYCSHFKKLNSRERLDAVWCFYAENLSGGSWDRISVGLQIIFQPK